MGIVSAIIASWFGRIGLLCVLGGICLYAYGKLGELPARSALQTVEGTVSEAKQITRTRTRRGQSSGSTSIDFQITITRPSGLPVELTMPSQEITRDQVISIINRPVQAEYDGDRDVYALSSGGRTIIAYETTVQKRSGEIAAWADRGKIIFGIGLPLMLVGWPLGARKLRKQAAAMQAPSAQMAG